MHRFQTPNPIYESEEKMTNQNQNQNTSIVLADQQKLRFAMRAPDVLARFEEVVGDKQAGGYITSVLLAVAESPSLQKCEINSVISAAMHAATMRLSVDPSIAHAYLVPFRTRVKIPGGQDIWIDKATFIIGYKGLQYMAIRSNHYRYLNLTNIYADDVCIEDRRSGLIVLKNGTVSVVADRNKRLHEDPVAYLFYMELLSGYKKTFLMTCEECDEHGKKYSKNYYNRDGTININSLWHTNPHAMYKKTVVRGAMKNAYLDPMDLANMSSFEESDEFEQDFIKGIDFSQMENVSPEDALARLGAGDQEEKPAPAPKKKRVSASKQESASAPAPDPAPATDPAPAPARKDVMTYEEAFNTTAHDGAKYGNMGNDELKHHQIGINKKLMGELSAIEQNSCQNKLEAIRILLAVPEADRLRATGQPNLPMEVK